MMKTVPIMYIFNSPIDSGCDYVVQTIRVASASHPVYGIALGDVISLPRLLMSKDKWILRRRNEAFIIRPISIIPGIRFRWVKRMAYMTSVIVLRTYIRLRHASEQKIVWVFEPFYMPSLLFLLPGYTKIYDCVDYFPGFNKRAKNEHEKVMKQATHVFANSRGLAQHLRKVRKDTKQVVLGFSPSLFVGRTIRSVSVYKKPFVIGYIGGISDRLDFELLHSVIRALPAYRFIFVGAMEPHVFDTHDFMRVQFDTLCTYKNVQYIPEVPKSEIPAIMQSIDVGIIPYGTDRSFNRYSFPMKTLEYFAAGKPVIATDIYALRPYHTKGLITTGMDAEEWTRALRNIHKAGWNHEKQQRQMNESMAQTWEKKVLSILKHIGI